MAADYNLVAGGKSSFVITVLTGSVKKVLLTQDDWLIQHLGLKNDGTTASSTGDAVVVMNCNDSAGNAITMAANSADGAKTYVPAAVAIPPQIIMGYDIPPGPDGPYEVQLQAVGNGGKVQFVRRRAA